MSDGFDPALRSAVKNIARVPQLLVACDYDGTLAPFVTDPSQAVPLPQAVAAVRIRFVADAPPGAKVRRLFKQPRIAVAIE